MTDESKQKKEFYDLVAYVEGRKTKVGFAYKTDNGALCIKSEGLMDTAQLGRLLKKGLYIEKREPRKKEAPS